MRNINELEKLINYEFKDKALIKQALSHSSVQFNGKANHLKSNPHNHYERLEFLGDRVLGLVISEHLFAAYPKEAEGELNLRFAQLVRKETCTYVAKKLEIFDFIRLGANEQKTGLAQNETILGDVCEALIAAIYLDSDFDQAKKFILKYWDESILANLPKKQDAKTALQEWAQKHKYQLPHYKVLQTEGPAHAPEFTIEVTIIDQGSATAIGSSKRIAEQKAAHQFLTDKEIWPK